MEFIKRNQIPIPIDLLTARLHDLPTERKEKILQHDPYSDSYSFTDPFFKGLQHL